MNFAPKTEQQAQEEGLLPAGTYDFEVAGAKDTFSQKGNEMIEAQLNVLDGDGQIHKVRDYLLESMALKLRHFAYATGLGPNYEKGTLKAEDLQGRCGKLKIRIDPAKNGYRAKSVVDDYIPPGNGAAMEAQAPLGRDPRPEPPLLDDEIPFSKPLAA